MTLGQGQEMTLILNSHIPSFTQIVVSIFQLSGHRLQLFLKNPLSLLFSYRKAYVAKFDLAVKSVKVNPGSSFEQSMIGRSLQCYIQSFLEIGPSVPEKIFEVFLSYMGMVANLVMTTNFHFLVPESLHTKFGSKRPSGF